MVSKQKILIVDVIIHDVGDNFFQRADFKNLTAFSFDDFHFRT